MAPAIVWFRRNLRLDDNAPLDAGSLVWAAIWAWFRGLFERIFGSKKE